MTKKPNDITNAIDGPTGTPCFDDPPDCLFLLYSRGAGTEIKAPSFFISLSRRQPSQLYSTTHGRNTTSVIGRQDNFQFGTRVQSGREMRGSGFCFGTNKKCKKQQNFLISVHVHVCSRCVCLVVILLLLFGYLPFPMFDPGQKRVLGWQCVFFSLRKKHTLSISSDSETTTYTDRSPVCRRLMHLFLFFYKKKRRTGLEKAVVLSATLRPWYRYGSDM